MCAGTLGALAGCGAMASLSFAEPVIFDNSDETFVWPLLQPDEVVAPGDFLDITAPPEAQAGITSGLTAAPRIRPRARPT